MEAFEHEIRVAARPETVFGFFTDPRKLVQWMGAEATLDPRPGGVCRIVFRTPFLPDGVNTVMGEFVAVEPYSRVAFTWGFENEMLAMRPHATVGEDTSTADGSATI